MCFCVLLDFWFFVAFSISGRDSILQLYFEISAPKTLFSSLSDAFKKKKNVTEHDESEYAKVIFVDILTLIWRKPWIEIEILWIKAFKGNCCIIALYLQMNETERIQKLQEDMLKTQVS